MAPNGKIFDESVPCVRKMDDVSTLNLLLIFALPSYAVAKTVDSDDNNKITTI
jgi:hypothetical protein